MSTTPGTPPTHRSFPFGKLIVGVAAGFALALAFGAGALLAYEGQYTDRIYPGVVVDGIDVSGLTRAQAIARLEAGMASYTGGSAVVSVDGTPVTIPYAALGRRADVEALADRALAFGRTAGDPLGRAVGGVRTYLDGARIGPLVTLDAGSVQREVAAVAARVNRDPVSGTVSATKTGFAATPSTPGRALPSADVIAELTGRLADPAAPDTLALAYTTTPVPPAVDDAQVTDAAAAASRMAQGVVVAIGTEKWTIPAATVRSWIQFALTSDGFHATVDPAAPTTALTALAKTINRAPRDATLLVGRGSAVVVGVSASQDGRTLDVAASAPVVAQAVVDRAAANATPAPVALAVAITAPKLTTDQAQKVAPLMRKVSSWTTYYEVSERNGFGRNITIPANDLNGTVVPPGAVFDFWSSIGPVTYARGYRDGGAIINGHSQPTGALAGGICSASTTLFNAVARAGYETLSKHNHYYYITRYPTGLDATVAISGGSVTTMSWRNDTKYPVLIRSSASPGVVTFSLYTVAANGGPSVGGGSKVPGSANVIYHVANGRTVTFSTSAKRNYSVATSSVQQTTSLPPGHFKVVEYPDNGFDITVTRSVWENGSLIHSDSWTSHYARVNGLTLVGVKATAAPPPNPSPAPNPTPAPSPTPAPTPAPAPASPTP